MDGILNKTKFSIDTRRDKLPGSSLSSFYTSIPVNVSPLLLLVHKAKAETEVASRVDTPYQRADSILIPSSLFSLSTPVSRDVTHSTLSAGSTLRRSTSSLRIRYLVCRFLASSTALSQDPNLVIILHGS